MQGKPVLAQKNGRAATRAQARNANLPVQASSYKYVFFPTTDLYYAYLYSIQLNSLTHHSLQQQTLDSCLSSRRRVQKLFWVRSREHLCWTRTPSSQSPRCRTFPTGTLPHLIRTTVKEKHLTANFHLPPHKTGRFTAFPAAHCSHWWTNWRWDGQFVCCSAALPRFSQSQRRCHPLHQRMLLSDFASKYIFLHVILTCKHDFQSYLIACVSCLLRIQTTFQLLLFSFFSSVIEWNDFFSHFFSSLPMNHVFACRVPEDQWQQVWLFSTPWGTSALMSALFVLVLLPRWVRSCWHLVIKANAIL